MADRSQWTQEPAANASDGRRRFYSQDRRFRYLTAKYSDAEHSGVWTTSIAVQRFEDCAESRRER